MHKLRNGSKRDSNQGSLDGESGILPLSHRLIQRPVHQSFGLVNCKVGLAKNGVFGSHLG